MQRNPYISRFVERLAILCALQSVWLTVHAKLAQLKVEKIGRTGDLWSTDTRHSLLEAPWRLHPFDTVFFGGGRKAIWGWDLSVWETLGKMKTPETEHNSITRAFLLQNSSESTTFPIRLSSWKVHENVGVLLQKTQLGQVWDSVTKVLPCLVTTSQPDICKCAFPWKNEGSA